MNETWKPSAPPTVNPTQARLAKFRAALVDTSRLDEIPDPEPLIEGILCCDSLAWGYGRPGSCKSLLALDWAGCVATGRPWHGRQVRQGPVVYIVAEGVSGVRRRVRAWEERHGRAMGGVTFLPVPVQLRNGVDLDAFLALVAEMRPVLVVIDTMARCTLGVSENDNAEMGKVVAAADEIRAATGACVVLVHHSGRSGENLRGASAIDGAATTVIRVTKDGEYVEVQCEKQKDSEEFQPVFLRLQPVLESVVLELRPDGTNAASELKILETMWDCYGTTGATGPQLLASSELTRTTFYRALNSLVRRGALINIGTQKRAFYRLPEGQEVLPSPTVP